MDAKERKKIDKAIHRSEIYSARTGPSYEDIVQLYAEPTIGDCVDNAISYIQEAQKELSKGMKLGKGIACQGFLLKYATTLTAMANTMRKWKREAY